MFKRSRAIKQIVLKLQDEWTIADIIPLKHQLGDSIKLWQQHTDPHGDFCSLKYCYWQVSE